MVHQVFDPFRSRKLTVPGLIGWSLVNVCRRPVSGLMFHAFPYLEAPWWLSSRQKLLCMMHKIFCARDSAIRSLSEPTCSLQQSSFNPFEWHVKNDNFPSFQRPNPSHILATSQQPRWRDTTNSSWSVWTTSLCWLRLELMQASICRWETDSVDLETFVKPWRLHKGYGEGVGIKDLGAVQTIFTSAHITVLYISKQLKVFTFWCHVTHGFTVSYLVFRLPLLYL